jgi:WD40 repeat protein
MLRLLLALVVVIGSAVLRPSFAADPGPYLRVETGDHEADINALALLDNWGALVTVSDDKTARIWSAAKLEPEGILRPPVGPADEGALYAVATHGDQIVLAGRTGTPGHYALYFFNRQGRAQGSISGISQPITALRFSADGTVLAVGLQDRGGLRLFNMQQRTEMPGDAGFVGAIHGLDFDAQGRIAAATPDDATVRLYAADGHRLSVVALPRGAQPWSVAFSPQGRMLAVGDRQASCVYLIDTTSMQVIRTLTGAPDRTGGFTSVAFGPDGSYIVAAGLYSDRANLHYARSWSVANGQAVDAPLARDTVNAIALLHDGMVFASAVPSVGRTDTGGHVVLERTAHHIDFRDAGLSTFRISPDGSEIELPANRPDGRHVVFDVPQRVLALREGGSDFTPPLDSGPGLKFVDWRNSHTPRLLDGKPIILEPTERALSVAVSPRGDGGAIGTDFFVRFISPSGEVWHKVADAPVWAINVSGDGTRVVAGMGNGTLHWYDAATGVELCALFIEPATGRWVLSTPEGFFDHDHPNDASPDGRSLIGYDFNTADGRAADFIQIGQLYPSFFRPDVVGLSFRNTPQARDVVQAQRQRIGDVRSILAQGLPPTVKVTDYCGHASASRASGCPTTRSLDARSGGTLTTTADEILLDYRIVAARGGKLGEARLTRNGAVIAPHIFTVEEDDTSRTQEARIPLGMGVNVFRVSSVTASGQLEASAANTSEIQVVRTAPAAAVAAAAPSPGPAATPVTPSATPAAAPALHTTLFLLSVGVSHFARPELNLDNASNDAKAIAALFAEPSPPVYDKTVTTTLLDDQATAANIEATMKSFAQRAGPDDIVLLFFAGHGQQVDGHYYFAPYDFGTHDDALFKRAIAGNLGSDQWLNELFRREGVGQEVLIPDVQAIQSSRLVMILDTCFSASIATQDAVLRQDANSTITNALGHASGRFVLSSASARALDSANGPHLPSDGQGHGLFTSYLLRALEGAADFMRTGRITATDAARYTQVEVQQATAHAPETQKPEFYFNGNTFIDLRAIRPAGASPPG